MNRRLITVPDGKIREIVRDWLSTKFGDDFLELYNFESTNVGGQVLDKPGKIGYPKMPFCIELTIKDTPDANKIAGRNGLYQSVTAKKS